MFARRHRPDRNPLRRPSDRAESAVLAVLCVAFSAAAPFVSRPPGAPVSSGFEVDSPEVLARWTAPDETVVTGTLPIAPDTAAGTTVRVWVTREGEPTEPPLRDSRVSSQAQLAAVLGVAGLAVAVALAGVAGSGRGSALGTSTDASAAERERRCV